MDNENKAKIGASLESIKNLLEISQNSGSIGSAWYVGAAGHDNEGVYTDFAAQYIREGRWENRNENFIDQVKSMQIGDRIAIKASYTRKKDLPFNNNGQSVSVMGLKAIGIITANPQDGKNITVEWEEFPAVREWYGPMVLRRTVHLVQASDGPIAQQLLDFTFNARTQDYSMCEELYKDTNIVDDGELANDLEENEMETNSFHGNNFSRKTCLDIVRKARMDKQFPLNMIIYGAPGTGKTYGTAEYALKIIGTSIPDNRKAVMQAYNAFIRKGQIVFTTFHQNYGYEEFIQGLRPDTTSEKMAFKTVDGVFKRIADRALNDDKNNYVIIIDEINRANISKVFGELITLVEDDKRWGEVNETCATLQSGDIFAVPNNLYIVGTMNSADKSISLIDAALRRRFSFKEQRPDADLISDPTLKNVFTKLNSHLSDALGSSDLLIGHSYFMGKAKTDLSEILNNNIIPLLYEYFYDNKKNVFKALVESIDGLNIEVVDDKIGRLYIKEKAK